MVESIKIKVGHQFSFHIINSFAEGFNKLVEILFVKKDLMTVITVVIKAFAAFCDSEVVVVTTGGSYIKEISPAFTGTNPFAVNAFQLFFVVILVRHS